MKKIHYLSILVAAAFSMKNLHAQDSTAIFKPKTVLVEEMVGNKRQFLQFMVNKVGYFGVMVPPVSVKQCHFERSFNNTKKMC